MPPGILRISLYNTCYSDSSVGRRGVVSFVQPCVGLTGLKRKNNFENITFHKLANEAERKYP